MLARRLRHLRTRTAHLLQRYARATFSQEGEDIVLQRLLEHDAPGIYVDVGAHHPSRFSNTRLLYDQGWHGLNIDALPGSMSAFRKARPRDVNVEIGVALEPGTATYWQFVEPALSTFDGEVAASRLGDGHALSQRIEVRVDTLDHLIDKHLGTMAVDVLLVDAEGSDLDVLSSFDWNRHNPRVVVVESTERVCDLSKGPAAFLSQRGYTLYAATGLSRVFLYPQMPPN